MKNIEFDESTFRAKGLKRFLSISKQVRQNVQTTTEEEEMENLLGPCPSDTLRDAELLKLQILKREFDNVVKSKAQLEELSDTEFGGLNEIEPIFEVMETHHPTTTDSLYIYDNYNFNYEYDKDLPVYNHRLQILETIQEYPVCVIAGSTGSGKTTVIPQFIIDHHAKTRTYCNILITQPRRVAAISTATRVSSERGWPLGSVVGYSVSLNKNLSDDTRLFYVTTGVLLQSLVSNPYYIHSFSHIIIDEVHERTEEIDLCLLVLKEALKDSLKTKIILMSATIETSIFTNYFDTVINNVRVPAPVIEIYGQQYEVQLYYINNIPFIEAPKVDAEIPNITEESTRICYEIIKNLSNFDLAFSQGPRKTTNKSVLVFLPGLHEIVDLTNILRTIEHQHKLIILNLHSKLPPEEQITIFRTPKEGWRKIILATNIAESSITVPDIAYVIDFCLQKYVHWDKHTNLCHLETYWISKSSAEQRKGRAGRIADGMCFRLVSEEAFNKFDQYSIPDMKRKPLEFAVLNVKRFFKGPPILMLKLVLEPPEWADVLRSILILKEIGALTVTKDGKFDQNDGNVTFLGSIIHHLPLDVKSSKLIAMGYIFGLIDECIIIAACVNLGCIFTNPTQKEIEAYISKQGYSLNSDSDLLAYLQVYRVYHQLMKTHSPLQLKKWGRDNFVNAKKLDEVTKSVEDIVAKLSKINVQPNFTFFTRDVFSDPKSLFLLKVLIAAAYYPNYFVSNNQDLNSANKLFKRDALTTVLLPNRTNYSHPKSINQFIYDMFSICGPIESIAVGHHTAFIEFNTPKEADEIDPAIQRALFYRKISRSSFRRQELESHLSFPNSPLVLQFKNICRETGKSHSSLNCTYVNYHKNLQASTLLVAAEVTMSGKSVHVVANETTIFPECVGLSELLTLLFTPFALMRSDLHGTRYVGALCGLGYESERKDSIFPQNDIEIVFPFRFTNTDLELANSVRTYISNTLGGMVDNSSSIKFHIGLWMERVIDHLFNYLEAERPLVAQNHCVTYSWAYDNLLPDQFEASDLIFKPHFQTY